MLKKYTDNILVDNSILRGGICLLNTDIKNILIEDVYEYNFNGLYNNLFINFYKNGMLDHLNIDIDIYNRVLYFIENKEELKMNDYNKYVAYRVWCNKLYIKELQKHTHILFEMYHQYMEMYYDEVIKNNNWLYIDTDSIFLTNDIKLDDIGFKIDIIKTNHSFSMFLEKKRYVLYETPSDYKIKGISALKSNDIISLIKSKIRDRKIDSII